jgi:hypothetical protein
VKMRLQKHHLWQWKRSILQTPINREYKIMDLILSKILLAPRHMQKILVTICKTSNERLKLTLWEFKGPLKEQKGKSMRLYTVIIWEQEAKHSLITTSLAQSKKWRRCRLRSKQKRSMTTNKCISWNLKSRPCNITTRDWRNYTPDCRRSIKYSRRSTRRLVAF